MELKELHDVGERPVVTQRPRLTTVIPAFRASATVARVVSLCLQYSDQVIVVDDACPESSGDLVQRSFASDDRVAVVHRSQNGGVGAATKSGIARALADGAEIIVKIDADGQMDPRYIETIRDVFEHDPSLVCVKGNRFFQSEVLSRMPKMRLIGNGALSFLVKGASGYWNAIDPTNGYIAFNAELLKVLPWESFDDSYFFEISILCELGLRRLPILELEMPTIYTEAPSSLSIRRVIRQFPLKIAAKTLRRLFLQYFILDINLGTVYALVGGLLVLFSIVFGSYEWIDGAVTHTAKPVGTVMLAALPFMMGFQLLLNALMYDVQFCQKTHHELLVTTKRRSLSRLANEQLSIRQ